MSLPIGRFTPYQALAASPLAGGGASAAAADPRTAPVADAVLDAIPPAPTQEARDMVDRAAQVIDDLYKSNRELHFSVDRTTNRVVIEVRDLEGKVLKTIPPAKALDVMSGAEL
jgi:flagellar protein FlaG